MCENRLLKCWFADRCPCVGLKVLGPSRSDEDRLNHERIVRSSTAAFYESALRAEVRATRTGHSYLKSGQVDTRCPFDGHRVSESQRFEGSRLEIAERS